MKQLFTKRPGLNLLLTLFVLTSVFSVLGASGDVDPGFNPQLTVDLSNQGGNLIIQPDGKILVFGGYLPAGGSIGKTFVKRLNPDGSTDTTFDCQECRSFFPRVVGLQSDGKILIGGNDKVIRVNQDGSLDTSFSSPFNPNLRCETKLITVQPDDKSLIGCTVYNGSLVSHEYVARLNTDGSVDNAFTTIIPPPSQFVTSVLKIAVLPDNRILVGGGRYGDNSGWLNRYDSDGSLDSSFQAPQTSSNGRIREIELQPDGKFLVGAHYKVYRLLSDGSIDPSFSTITVSPQNQYITAVKFLSNGQVYISLFTLLPSPSVVRFVRYDTSGNIDNSFNPAILDPGNWTIDSSDRIVVSKNGFQRLNLDGTIDSSFNPNLSGDGYVNAVAVQSDGKMIVVGEFSKTNGFDSGRITRINADGSADTSFNTGSGFDSAPKGVSIQPDGKILVSGRFSSYNGTTRTMVARLNSDGSLDATFNPEIIATAAAHRTVNQIVYLPTNKILIGGNFTSVNGQSRMLLAMLNPDGSLDMTFDSPTSPDPFATTNKIYVQSNGQILVAFGSNLRRYNSDGSLDNSFAGPGNVTDIIQRPDGKYLVSFKDVDFASRTITYINNDGSIDYSFPSVNTGNGSSAYTVFRQSNGNIIFGGRFLTVNSRPSKNIARVGQNGESDIYFPTFGANGDVKSIFGQPDGKIIFVGDFDRIENVGRSGIARLTLSNRLRGTLFDFDGDGRSDISVFRPSTNTWYSLLSGNSSVGIQTFGANGDIPVPADYDGDGKTDIGIFRPSTGVWIYLFSQSNTVFQFNWGLAGDIPLPADVTGDGKADIVVYRPSNNNWYRYTGGSPGAFGIAGDKPLIGDFDGDSRADIAIFRPSTGTWWYAASSATFQHRAIHWGIAEDIPAPGDYDGDGTTDVAVFRPSTGVWYILKSTGGYTIIQFGLAEDKPVPGDYDGDGKTDIAVFRPSTGVWYLFQSTSGISALQWGISTDIPIENAFIH